MHAVLFDLAEFGQGKDLIAARVGQDGPFPAHETMEAAKVIQHLGAGSNKKVVGVAQNDPGIQCGIDQFGRVGRFHRAPRAHWHETRRFHRGMRQLQPTSAGFGFGIGLEKGKQGRGLKGGKVKSQRHLPTPVWWVFPLNLAFNPEPLPHHFVVSL